MGAGGCPTTTNVSQSLKLKSPNKLSFNNRPPNASDEGFDNKILHAIDADPDFGKALKGGGVGLHYPCDTPHPEVQGKPD